MTDVSRCCAAGPAAVLPFPVDVIAEPEGQDASRSDTLTGCRLTALLRDECESGAAGNRVTQASSRRVQVKSRESLQNIVWYVKRIRLSSITYIRQCAFK